MISTIWNLPYTHFLMAGAMAGIVALMRSKLRNKPPTENKRRLDAALCGIGALGICWIAWRLFPNRFDFHDAIPYGIAIGFLGAGRIYEAALRRFDSSATLDSSFYSDDKHENKD